MGDELDPTSVALSAKATGLRDDQVAAAIEEYRLALASTSEEPEWILEVSMRGGIGNWNQYRSEGTQIIKFLFADGASFEYARKPFCTWQEARSFELRNTTRPKPRLATRPSTEGSDA